MVSGSDLYNVKIAIAPVKAARWKSICRDCAGTIDSLVELLQGRLAKGVMDRVCREGDGLFPSPDEIKLSCSCPDWADMCKHVAAALYGVGARLDEKPQLLFVLRGVDENELIASAGQDLPLSESSAQLRRRCSTTVMSPPCSGWRWPRTVNSDTPSTVPKRPQRSKTMKGSKTPAGAKSLAAKKSNSPRAPRTKSEPKWVALVRARKRRAHRQPQRSAMTVARQSWCPPRSHVLTAASGMCPPFAALCAKSLLCPNFAKSLEIYVTFQMDRSATFSGSSPATPAS